MNPTLEVLESKYVKPINDRGGWYVRIKFTRGSRAVDKEAMEEAEKNGYDPNGAASVGFDVRHGITTYTRAYWFYDKKKVAARRDGVMDQTYRELELEGYFRDE